MSRFTDRLPGPLRHWWALLGLSVVVVFALVQLVPYRVDNPPVKSEPAWDSPRTRELAKVACFDCHSNETNTYAWEDVAPAVVVDHEPRQGGPRQAQLLRMGIGPR